MCKSYLGPRIVLIGMVLIAIVLSDRAQAKDAAQNDPYAVRKVFYERHWQQKITSALRYVDGAVVCVNVQLTPEIQTVVKRENFGDRPVAEFQIKRAEEVESDSHQTSVQGAGRTGDSPQSRTLEEQISKMAIGKTNTVSTVAGLIPTRVSVTVSIPRSYIRDVWSTRYGNTVSQQRSDKEGQLVKIQGTIRHMIRQTVMALVPSDPEGDVEVLIFDDVAGVRKMVSQATQRRSSERADVAKNPHASRE